MSMQLDFDSYHMWATPKLAPVDLDDLTDKLLQHFKSYDFPMTKSGIIEFQLGHQVVKKGILIRCEAPMVFFNKLETVFKFQNFGNTSNFSTYRYIRIPGWKQKFGLNKDQIFANLKAMCKYPVEWEYWVNYNAVMDEVEKKGNNLLGTS